MGVTMTYYRGMIRACCFSLVSVFIFGITALPVNEILQDGDFSAITLQVALAWTNVRS